MQATLPAWRHPAKGESGQRQTYRRARKFRRWGRCIKIAVRRLRTGGIHRAEMSLRPLRFIPSYIERDCDDEVRSRGERLAVFILRAFVRRHHPDVAIVVAAELALWIRTFGRRCEKAGWAHLADKFLVVVAVDCVEFFERPFGVHAAEFDIIRRVELAVRSAIVRDGFELLVAFRELHAAEPRQGGV